MIKTFPKIKLMFKKKNDSHIDRSETSRARYYKIINIAKLKEHIPEGLEDPYTEILDEVASEKGFIRLDEGPA